jgi:N,N-dimethylglycine/sarcosine dehydrogenase
MSYKDYPHLFSPITIRKLTLRNRVAISGHHAGWWLDNGMPSDEFAAYIEERSRNNGVGLFVIGCTSPVRPTAGWLENMTDDVIPRYRKCVEAAHRHGTALIAQLGHPGFDPRPGVPLTIAPPRAKSTQPVGHPSSVQRVLSIEELHELNAEFGKATRRCVEAGCDGIELHSHEWFFHSQMINPMWNRRTDQYGGSLENRMRFMLETLTEMRNLTGPVRVIGVRLKCDDMEQRGNSLEDYKEIVRRLEATKLIDYVLFTGGDARLHHGPMPRPEREWLGLIKEHKANTKLVVMHAGRIMDAASADRAIAEGIVDVVCMTKAHIADGKFTAKVFAGNENDIRQCTRCLQACHHAMHRMTCVYNPLTSRELMWGFDLKPAERKKRAVVIGAGPAGMEFAVTASARGHEVIVLEKSNRIGGQVLIGGGSPWRKPWLKIAEFYERQRVKGEFDVRLNTPATVDLVKSLAPDMIIVATGSTPNQLTLASPGPRVLTVHELIAGQADGAKNAIVVDREFSNRPWPALDYLSSRGAKVHFVTPRLIVGEGIVETWTLDEYLRQLISRGVSFLPGFDLAEWHDDHRAVLRDIQTGEEQVIANVDCVVGLVGSAPNEELIAPLRSLGADLHVIGDANNPATVEAATFQGARLARMV